MRGRRAREKNAKKSEVLNQDIEKEEGKKAKRYKKQKLEND